jgi:hypothetical protein
MTNDKPPSTEPKLASLQDAANKQYVRIAKDYFAPKNKGVTVPDAVKPIIWVILLMSIALMLPELFSERKRQEIAEVINPPQNSTNSQDLQFPPLHSSEGGERKKSDADRKGSAPVQRIKSIDLRALGEPPPGSEVSGVLVSGGANGTVKVRLTENLVLNGDTYAAKNSILIGTGSSSDQRLFIRFTRLISPEGKSRKIMAEAYDFKDRIRGLNGKKVSDQVFKIAASSALIFMGGVADALQDNSSGGLGYQRKSMRDAALSGVAQATTEHGRRYLDSLDQDNRIEVQKETELVVIFGNGDDKE